MSAPLDGQAWLVTGAGSGFGRGLALALAEHGATVILAGRTTAKLEAVYDTIEQAGGPQPAIYPINLLGATVTDYDDMAAKLQDNFGGLHGLVHAAVKFDGLMPVAGVKPKDWASTLHVNLTAPQLITQACLPLLEGLGGTVVFVQDTAAQEQRAFWGPYSVSKAGLGRLEHLLREELENTSRIRVHGLCPPPMYTTLRRQAFPAELPGDTADPLQVARDLLPTLLP